jgi:hypothetical protein
VSWCLGGELLFHTIHHQGTKSLKKAQGNPELRLHPPTKNFRFAAKFVYDKSSSGTHHAPHSAALII